MEDMQKYEVANIDRMKEGYHAVGAQASIPCMVRRSPFSGRINAYIFPTMSAESFGKALSEWQSGLMIQEAFPMLSADAREFILTGITPEEWPSEDD